MESENSRFHSIIKNYKIMAQIGGKPIRIKLNTDLTRYDQRLTNGQEGLTIPGKKFDCFGSLDTFVAVKFDCGAALDILWTSLEIIDAEELQRIADYKSKQLEDLKTAENIELRLGPLGGFRSLSYEYMRDGISNSVGNGFKKSSEEILEYFRTLGKAIKTIYEK
jgi:hypothetical protein